MSSGISVTAPVTRRVRAYFAPVNRATGTPTIFDPAQQGRFLLDAPPAPWVDLGWIAKFARKSGSKVEVLRSGAPAVASAQVRTELEALVGFEFEGWGKLQLGLASGSQQMNLLAGATGVVNGGSGGVTGVAVPIVLDGSTNATALNVGAAAAAGFAAGDVVAVDVDFNSTMTGYVGSGVSAAYLQSAAAVNGDVNFVRRMTWNVGLVSGVANGVLQLGQPLLAGAPVAGMQVSKVMGFCDREGASFFQEWSAVFVMDGEQGDRVLFHYPRLQTMQGSSETEERLAAPLQRIGLAASFRALPVKDANDGETVLCFRSYLPAPMRLV